MKHLTTIASFAAVLAAPLSAQFVWPAQNASQPGGAAQNAPFTVFDDAGRSARSMTLIRASSLPFGPNTLLSQISFRRDAGHRTAYAAQSGRIKVQMGVARSDHVDHPTTSFELNYADQPTFVLDETRPDIVPAVAAPGGTPGFDLRLPFTRPWLYPGGDLIVDVFYVGDAEGVWRRDAIHVPDGGVGRFTSIGPGCAGSDGATPKLLVHPESAVPGSLMTLGLYDATRPANGAAGVAINFLGAGASRFAGLVLPYHLGDLGFPQGCWLASGGAFQQVVATQPSAAGYGYTGTASAEATYPLPASPSLAGTQVWSQWLCADDGVSAPLKFTVSNAARITLGELAPPSPPLARTIWSYGANGGAADSGTIASGTYAPVIEFR